MSTNSAGLREQYRDGSNLDARIALHARFGTGTRDFHDWLFDFVVAPLDAQVLELGCGTGQMWRTISHRVPATWHIVLTDFSPGMLTGLRSKIATFGLATAFAQGDAQAIPFPSGYFDVVFANHMLYHVPDLPRALAEIRRVLKSGGQLIAATNGVAHMHEIDSLAGEFGLAVGLTRDLPFTLESGATQLAPFFAWVVRHDSGDALAVTEAEPLVAYVLSMRVAASFFTPERTQRLREIIARRIASDGVFRISRSSGVFVCTT